ncbi:uncharacterized protein LOC124921406 [Impatiens glandulifera]|uniref:uncharacterized protein LOC124921406 n=1 Tax=Impatiens glandulifera TaxID=253017 RepID=UPI001FB13881|nr:uncharacterized protein LOC124921406 [Impatiens glandulifera]
MDHQTDEDNSSRSREATTISQSSANPIDSVVIVVIREEDEGNSSVTATDLVNKVITSDPCSISNNSLEETVVVDLIKVNKTSCVIDLKPNNYKEDEKIGEYSGGDERVCRICHLNSEQSREMMTTRAGLIQLGCGCKDELGIAHGHCAESWFKIRGNRQCEICGETAKNVMGVGDYRFMEAWNQAGPHGGGGSGTGAGAGGLSDGSERGCCRRQPFCNFLMGCLVIAFVLPWFFRVNMV